MQAGLGRALTPSTSERYLMAQRPLFALPVAIRTAPSCAREPIMVASCARHPIMAWSHGQATTSWHGDMHEATQQGESVPWGHCRERTLEMMHQVGGCCHQGGDHFCVVAYGGCEHEGCHMQQLRGKWFCIELKGEQFKWRRLRRMVRCSMLRGHFPRMRTRVLVSVSPTRVSALVANTW